MLKFKDRNSVPTPGWFSYEHPETHWRTKSSSFRSLLFAVQQYHDANSFPIPIDFSELVEDNACRQVPVNTMSHWVEERGKPTVPIQSKTFFRATKDYIRGTMAIANNILRGGEKVSAEEANRRASICVQCQFNVSPEDCKDCASNRNAMERTIRSIVGNASTLLDKRLGACWWCGCFLKAAVWWPIDILQRWQSAETDAQLPDQCWKKKSTKA